MLVYVVIYILNQKQKKSLLKDARRCFFNKDRSMSATGDKYLEDIFEFLYLPNNLSSILYPGQAFNLGCPW